MRWFHALIVSALASACGADPSPCGDGEQREAARGDGIERWCEGPAGRADGPYTQRDAAGAIIVEGAFVDGLPDGRWIWRDGTGAVVREGGFYRGLAHGAWVERDASGVISSHTFAYGVACGVWDDREPISGEVVTTDYGPCATEPAPEVPTAGARAPIDGPAWDRATCPAGTALAPPDPRDPRRAACAKDGVLQGPWSRIDASGAVVIEGAHEGGLLAGALRRWQLDPVTGQRTLVEHATFEAGREDGPHYTWRPDASPAALTRWADGVRDGAESTWHADGSRATEGAWRAGRRDGAWTTWDATGIERGTVTWADGVLDGPWVSRFPDGHPEVEGAYTDGLRAGTWTWSWPWGGARDERPYVDGLEQGTCRTWTALGSPDTEGDRVDGVAEGTWTQWTYLPDATVRERGAMVDGRQQGLWSGVYEPGDARASETRWRDGRREGDYAAWHPNGRDAIRGGFRDDEPDGPWRVWDEHGQLLVEGAYDAGTPVDLWRYYWPSGAERAELLWTESGPGQPRCWDESGTEVACEPYTIERLYLGSLD